MKIIGQENNEIRLSSLKRTESAKSSSPTRPQHENLSRKDSVDTSRIGHIMSKNIKDIEDLKTVRPEKIEAFKSFVENKPQFSDKVIDKILYHLTTT